ncbi:pyroglutamyl-peptidase I [Microbacterium sp. CFBP9034]|uniref:pyroglutamyl-peptidase I n=1 Tax=Microbacterium sp. CFBP9034 TaxID=3096540 RepID=UPI002A6AD8A0|nr:pyroglutamyl-peptidase I [Microbacterium sp. CFBP9034]MDY0909161.1 pyroglutamyl-peptidase I [Microbacterium sp. CFBP9034]
MTTILLTGFEPFGGDAVNPSGEAVRRVDAGWDGPETLVTAILPVTFDGARAELGRLIDVHRPELVIATGLAGNRAAISVERVAVNLLDARIPDNAGAQPVDEPSVGDGPAAYFASLPVKAIARDIAAAGIPSEVSHWAGTFVCNHAFYTALHATSRSRGIRAGFLHVPWSAEHAPSADAATLPLADIAEAIGIAVRTSLRTTTDAAISAGAIS